MDLAGGLSLLVSAAGLVVSIWALYKAQNAKQAVDRAIAKGADQEVRDKVRDLLAVLMEAKKAAMGHRAGASRASSAGRVYSRDLQSLEIAQDFVRTTLVAGSDQRLQSALDATANELATSIRSITTTSAERDGWSDAHSALQLIIPRLEKLESELKVKAIARD
jgi:hypothetical protein